MTEASLQRKCVKFAKTQDVLVWKVSAEHQRGLPDLLLVCPAGAVLFIEMKQPGGRLTALQDHTIKKIRDHKGHAYVCDSFSDFKEILQRHHREPGTGD